MPPSTQIELLKKYGLPIRGHSGQHLLVDPNMQKKIVDALELAPKDRVLEIGPGLGALTARILSCGCRVHAVEKDPRFVEILQGELGADYRGRLRIDCEDILKVKLDRIFNTERGISWKVISNLPYYITAPVLFHLLDSRRFFTKAILTMQREVASRLIATPGTKDYGRLSLTVRYAANVRHLFDIPPTCFTPKPAVTSSVVELEVHPNSKKPEGLDEDFLFHLIGLAFQQRRKTLLGLLSQDKHIGRQRVELKGILKRLNLHEKVRGEDLLLKDFIALAKGL